MEFFESLGRHIDRLWRARDYDERVFAEVAAEALARRPPHNDVSSDEIPRWVLGADRLPPQGNLDSAFGEPPVRVFVGPRFYIEALFWMDGTTSIHQHHFSGAFTLLDGTSIHCRYSFREEERVSTRLLCGELRLSGAEFLRPGDVRAIRSGNGFIHSVFHLDRPSVSIVVRTFTDGDSGPQYMYLPPGVALDPTYREDLLDRRLQTLALLDAMDHPMAEARAVDLVRAADPLTAFLVLHQASGRDESEGRLAAYATALAECHGRFADRFLAAIAEFRRTRRINQLRKTVRPSEHRFLLALYLNLPSREDFFQFVGERYVERDPAAAIARWESELAALGALSSVAASPALPASGGR